MPTWLEVQRIKAVFFLALYDIINDMKHLQNFLHHTSAVPQPFLLLKGWDAVPGLPGTMAQLRCDADSSELCHIININI